MKSLQKLLEKLIKETALALIYFYQRVFSPDSGIFTRSFGTCRCRFYPSCSAYAASSLRQYGLLRGSVVSLKRILKCNPWCVGGYDPVNRY